MLLTAFSWGYDGWGNSTQELLKAFASVERARGFEPPVFVDVRVRRAARAVGFQGNKFERLLGRERSRWLQGLGNERVLTHRGKMRLVRPADAFELLGIIVAQARQNRRVIFFCSCPSPSEARWCHRMLVRRTLLAAARKMRVPVVVAEWPGGTPSTKPVVIRVPAETIDAVRGGATGVKVPEPIAMKHAAIPHGQVVAFTDGKRRQLVACGTPVYRAGKWSFPVFVTPVEEGDSAVVLNRYSRRFRAWYGL